jgi:hypothetical protein
MEKPMISFNELISITQKEPIELLMNIGALDSERECDK